jgi:hypothetical protein
MKYTIEIPDDEAGTIIEAIRRLSAAIKLTPIGRPKASAAKHKDETDYLFRSQKNRARLEAAIEEVEAGESQPHNLLEP